MSEDNFIPIKLEFREGTLFRQLQDEIDVLKEQLQLSYAENKYILDQRDELQRKLDIAVEALKWYGGLTAKEALKKIEAQHE